MIVVIPKAAAGDLLLCVCLASRGHGFNASQRQILVQHRLFLQAPQQ
jgi:hypothetical protein